MGDRFRGEAMIRRLCIVAGSGRYPELLVRGARAAGVPHVDVLAVRGSASRATMRAADRVQMWGLGQAVSGVRWVAEQGYDGAILAGQINPLSLFRTRFDSDTLKWLADLPVKSAHTVYGRLVAEFERCGVRMLPASSYMDGYLPGEGPLTRREPAGRELSDIERGAQVMRDIGRHDVGQTVLVKDGMVLAVEAFEGTNAAIKRGGKLGGKGAVLVKGAREGHDMRFDIPVAGLKTLKTMKSAGVTTFAFQAGRLVFLDRDESVDYANRHGIAITGFKTDLPAAPLRPLCDERK